MVFSPVDRERLIPEIVKRRSIRGYKPDAVPEPLLARVLEAARLAPSARNRQPWRFIIVQDDETKRKLAHIAKDQMFIATAPVVIALATPTTDYVMTCTMPAHIVDLALAGEHICLQAAKEGLGTCWIGAFRQDEAKKLLGVPEEGAIVDLITLGYPDYEPSERSLLPVEDVVYWDRWNE